MESRVRQNENRHFVDDWLAEVKVHVQPRSGEPQPVRDRFVWEKSPMLTDADGRIYFHNENYWLVNLKNFRLSSENLRKQRFSFFDAISRFGEDARTNATYRQARGGNGGPDTAVCRGYGGITERSGGGHKTAAGIAGAVKAAAREFAEGIGEAAVGTVRGLGETVKDMREHPEVALAAAKDTVLGIAHEIKEVAAVCVLPKRTLARRERGERTSLGRLALDAIDSYFDFYNSMMIYRLKYGDRSWDREE